MKTEDLNLIQRYFDKELEGEELAQFKKKIEEDVEFAKDVQQFASMIIGIRAAEKKSVSKKQGIIINFLKPIAIAASFLCLIFIGYFFINKHFLAKQFYTQSNNQTIDSSIAKKIAPKDSIALKKINYLAENYRDNLKIEEILKDREIAYRSWVKNNRSSGIVRKISPKDSAITKINEAITFIIQESLKGGYHILIYNNNIHKVYESQLLHENANKLSVILPAGLYYWRIKTRNESPWCGKFYVIDL